MSGTIDRDTEELAEKYSIKNGILFPKTVATLYNTVLEYLEEIPGIRKCSYAIGPMLIDDRNKRATIILVKWTRNNKEHRRIFFTDGSYDHFGGVRYDSYNPEEFRWNEKTLHYFKMALEITDPAWLKVYDSIRYNPEDHLGPIDSTKQLITDVIRKVPTEDAQDYGGETIVTDSNVEDLEYFYEEHLEHKKMFKECIVGKTIESVSIADYKNNPELRKQDVPPLTIKFTDGSILIYRTYDDWACDAYYDADSSDTGLEDAAGKIVLDADVVLTHCENEYDSGIVAFWYKLRIQDVGDITFVFRAEYAPWYSASVDISYISSEEMEAKERPAKISAIAEEYSAYRGILTPDTVGYLYNFVLKALKSVAAVGNINYVIGQILIDKNNNKNTIIPVRYTQDGEVHERIFFTDGTALKDKSTLDVKVYTPQTFCTEKSDLSNYIPLEVDSDEWVEAFEYVKENPKISLKSVDPSEQQYVDINHSNPDIQENSPERRIAIPDSPELNIGIPLSSIRKG